MLLKRHIISETEESEEVKNIVICEQDKIQIEKDFELEEILTPKPESEKEQNNNTSHKAANKYIVEDGKIFRIVIKLIYIYLIVK